MTTKEYARALYTLFKDSPKADLGKEFTFLLKKKGELALLPGVIKELERMEGDEKRSKTCQVVVARDHDLQSSLTHARAFVKEHGGDPHEWTFKEKVDASLIGGYLIRTPEHELDMSDKRGLYLLYEKLRSVA
jgi:F0F1-type ATP synthase delta subunit